MKVRERVLKWVQERTRDQRAPDLVLRHGPDEYLYRWHLWKRNDWFNLYYHEFVGDDDTRALHDHPYLCNASWLLNGDYYEHVPGMDETHGTPLYQHTQKLFVKEGTFKFRWGPSPHRLEMMRDDGELRKVQTLFFSGPRVREWGFWCPRGWRHWKEFTSSDYTKNGSSGIGKGCD